MATAFRDVAQQSFGNQAPLALPAPSSTSLQEHFARAHTSASALILWQHTLPKAVLTELESQLEAVNTNYDSGEIKFKDKSSVAVFIPFTFAPKGGGNTFTNILAINPDIQNTCSPEQKRVSIWHERTHAAQWESSVVLHASPYNQATEFLPRPIFMSPEAWVLSNLATETDAYVKQAWLGSLAAQDNPYIRPILSRSPLSIEELEQIIVEKGDIQEALIEGARRCMQKLRDPKKNQTYYEHYVDTALAEYAACKRYEYDQNPVYVRLEDADFNQMGNAIGLSPFGVNGVDPAFSALLNLNDDQKGKLAELNEKHGISDYQSLPTMREAVLMNGKTPASFMELSRNYMYAPVTPPAAEQQQTVEMTQG